ncbi:MAG: hypothetical protein AAF802_04835 [Planctomycetota bacterium]
MSCRNSLHLPHTLLILISLSLLHACPPADGQVPELVNEEPSQPSFAGDELSRQLESNAARGGMERATAIRQLARIGNWPAVDRWVTELGKTDDGALLAAWSSEIGSDILLRISLEPSLSDGARAAMDKLLSVAKSENQNREQLSSAIDMMLKGDVNESLAARRRLIKGGQATSKALIDTIVSNRYARREAELIQLLGRLDPDGPKALEQLANYGSDQTRGPALRAFVRMVGEEEARDSLVCAAVARNASQEERSIASANLRLTRALSTTEAEAYLLRSLTKARALASRTPNDENPRVLWSIDESATSVDASPATEFFAAYRDAYDAAQRLNRLPALTPMTRREALGTELEYRVIVDPDWGTPDQIDAIVARYPEAQDTPFLLDTLRQEREAQREASSVGLIRLIASVSGSLEQLLVPNEGNFSAFVQATHDPIPRVRFEAATVIAERLSSGEISFPGKSFYLATLSEMKSLGPNPKAILIETRQEIAISMENVLAQAGVEVFPVTNAAAAEKLLAQKGDISLLLSKVMLPDSTATELVDRVRRLSRGKQVSIVFFTDDDTPESSRRLAEIETTSERWTREGASPAFLVDLPGSAAAFAPVLRKASVMQRLPPLTIGDRTQFRRTAEAALSDR